MGSDEIMITEQLLIFLQCFGYEYIPAICKKKMGVVVVTFASEYLISFNNMDLFRC